MAKKPIEVETLTHDATRKNIPTAEFESLMRDQDKTPIQLAYERRNRDLDPQLVWRGKDEQDWSDLIVQAPPLYIQEKVHPKVIIDDLKRESANRARATKDAPQFDMFADFNGLPDAEAATEFYQHDQHWSNRMISGDSLSVMASLAEREGLRGQVQCIYFDPPYGIKFNSNFQWSTTSRDVKDGDKTHVTREPEQVRAFRDTWKDGIHSYLTYLRDRLTVARDLLTDSGSIFVQIGDENVHRVRALMDEVFGEANGCGLITYKKTTGAGSPAIGTDVLAGVKDYIVWFAKDKAKVKYRQPYREKEAGAEGAASYNRVQSPDGMTVRGLRANEDFDRDYAPDGWRLVASDNLTSQTGVESTQIPVAHFGETYRPTKGGWKTNALGISRLAKASRVTKGGIALRYVRGLLDFAAIPLNDDWQDTSTGSFTEDKVYVVQSGTKAVARCILMTTDPGDLVLDPTCGSGTTAYVAEQWGRRWITIDTSRVAIALARSRLMGARYPYYLLADSKEGQAKEGEITRTPPKTTPTHGSIRQGFVYDRVPHITLKSIANNAEIDVIWDRLQPAVEDAITALNAALAGHPTPFKVETGGRAGAKIDFTARGEVKLPSGEMAPANGFMEWEIPREAPSGWPAAAQAALKRFWEARITRQREIDASIAAKAEFEYLYDKPYDDKSKVRVAGPFTVESLSPHRTLAVDWDDELIDTYEAAEGKRKAVEAPRDFTDFAHMVLENLKAAGVQQAHKEDRITFTSLKGWPGNWIAAEGTFMEGDTQRRAGVFIGPEFGTVSRPDLVAAAREAGDAGFDVLICCAFNYDAHSSEFDKLGRIRVLKARMNPDLHMGGDLKSTGAGNLFVIFGEPDIRITDAGDGMVQVQVFGVDVFKPQTGEVQSEGTDGIALWMLDTDYNEESFFVRHAYFLGANDPYKALKTTLKAEIDEEAWESLYSDTSRPFPKPKSGRIAVKVINHLGDEVMKVFAVE
ncbi:site-specific DNA-methyltransferase [Rhodobacter veldkampii DSM 11550]|uniref:site-specific DNA-methyltransferase (adenine-specific) n=1 Tax=Phaeovulum veldkampii DSM 11550 TaxID=1185920 RepID=A0A2T4JD01_9RHOB|nr:DNA methyltransferase [Phaeovulum veldkampii]MBK5946443.1 site-specific DNA-methyltransferase [Phaeovulum veldkampii DSM 11550]PTE15784.1 site-specific DNA-methyltransferase [Phaeovulum veldkampii DSM 11550]TDQ54510.1 adenine-specific DNA-methyltransferase [Phaeovulum veldkampii DSM 11550]